MSAEFKIMDSAGRWVERPYATIIHHLDREPEGRGLAPGDRVYFDGQIKYVEPEHYHVVPVEDTFEHEDDENCNCKPARSPEFDGKHYCGAIIVHNSWDGREMTEPGVDPLPPTRAEITQAFVEENGGPYSWAASYLWGD